MEIIPLIPERDVAVQRARVAQNRDIRTAQELHTCAQQLHEASGNRAYWAEECGNLGQLALRQNKQEEAEGFTKRIRPFRANKCKSVCECLTFIL